MSKMSFFTIKTISEAGLGDQIGTQFARLYLIGKALDLQYLHTPFQIPRSTNSALDNVVNDAYLGLGKSLISISQKLPFLKFLFKPFYYLFKSLIKLARKIGPADKINALIGTNYYDNIPKDGFQIDVSNYVLKAQSKNELLSYIQKDILNQDGHLILKWTPELYSLSYKLDELFNEGKTINYCDFLKSKFPQKSEKLFPSFVIHIRCGDSVTIHHPHGDVEIYANKVTFLNKNKSTNISGDNNRKAISVDKFKGIIDGYTMPANVKTILISDGYKLSKIVLLDYFLKNASELVPLEKKIIKDILKRDLDKEMIKDKFEVDNYIIGESYVKFKESLHTLSEADVLLFGHGGFSYYIHSIYRQNPDSYIAHALEKHEVLFANFDKALSAKSL